MRFLLTLTIAIAGLLSRLPAAGAAQVYSNSFNGPVGTSYPEWSSSTIAYTSTGTPPGSGTLPAPLVTNTSSPNSAERFLGEFGGPRIGVPGDPGYNHTRVDQTISLALSNLPAHSSLQVAFDLCILKSWDGNAPAYGPDRFILSVAGGPVLLDTTFSNNPKATTEGSYQDYPAPKRPPWSGAFSTNTLGYSPFFYDGIYRLQYTFAHTGRAATLNFHSSLFEGKGTADESWGLDNVTVATVPKPASDHGPLYRLVNRTGKFSDVECFWSLNGGKEWHSFAEQPTVPCPRGNGRLYFRFGAAPKNFGDREAFWDFIEYASENSETWHGNTTQVDAFCIPITIEMGDKKVGITESHRALFEQFRKDAPAPFQSCVKGDWWIVSPCAASFGAKGTNAHYFDAYIDEVWATYAQEKQTPSGKWTGKVTDGALTFTPVGAGKPVSCPSKPSTQDAFMGTGVLARNPQFCAAINRHVLADPADWRNADAFYKMEPCNWYAKFLHEHSINKKAYGFCYDDVAEQAAFFSGKGPEVVVTLRWDSEAKEK